MLTSSRPSSDPALLGARAGRLIVLEGMPGAGKTTAVGALARRGLSVVGEYTDNASATLAISAHPDIGDDDAHQLNWLRKAAQCAARLNRHQAVYADRDWLSSLSYAYSAAPADGGALLARRAGWAARHLGDGTLLLPDTYVLFDLDPASSLARRAGRLRPGHPWNHPESLARLRAFYRDPGGSLRPTSGELADALASPALIGVSGHDDPPAILSRLLSLAAAAPPDPAGKTR